MKKIYFLPICLVALLSSCEKRAGQALEHKDALVFSIGIENQAVTRADDGTPTRYIMELYEVSTLGSPISGAPIQRVEQSSAEFPAILEEGKSYTALFYADYGTAADGTEEGNDYNAADLRALFIEVQPSNVCYAGSDSFTYTSTESNKPYLTQVLTHAVAALNFVQSEDLVEENSFLSIDFPTTYSFDIATGTTTDLSKGVRYFYGPISACSANSTIANFYIIANSTAETVMDLTYFFNSIEAKEITSVPFRRNYRTNIKSAFGKLYNASLVVTCEDEWDAAGNSGF